ncbi:MAG: tetratricopeptide repeat protein, partial [Planctomycetia bacterium]|nr:tetratricopeptide repeat protein [Planctomycetia bacterium]
RRLGRRLSDAVADYDAAIKLVPGSAVAYLGRGQAKASLGQLDAALADFAKALELDPRDPRILVARANVYVRQGKDDLAVADLESAIKANPRIASAYDRLACLYLNHRDEKLRNSAKAVEYARRACELSQWLCSDYVVTLTEAYRAAGDNSRATEARIAALRIAMAEKARGRNWQLESFFNRCQHCGKDDTQCRCEHPLLDPGAKPAAAVVPSPPVSVPPADAPSTGTPLR